LGVGLALATVAPALADSADDKLQQIQDIAAQSRSGVITLDDKSYEYYARQPSYHVVVLLVASHPKYRCTTCAKTDKEFRLLAESFKASQAKLPAEKRTDVFFARLDFEGSQRTFERYGITSVPVMFHIAPSRGLKKTTEWSIAARDRYSLPATPEAEGMAAFLGERTGTSVEVKRSMLGAYLTLAVVFGLLALMVRPVIERMNLWLSIIRRKGIWTLVSLGFYAVGVSGIIFDVIRSPQLYYMNPNTGQINFFYWGPGQQFVAEGLIIGALNISCAAALLVLVIVVPTMKPPVPVGRARGSAPPPDGALSPRNVIFFLCITVFVVCFYSVKGLYAMKNRWYRG